MILNCQPSLGFKSRYSILQESRRMRSRSYSCMDVLVYSNCLVLYIDIVDKVLLSWLCPRCYHAKDSCHHSMPISEQIAACHIRQQISWFGWSCVRLELLIYEFIRNCFWEKYAYIWNSDKFATRLMFAISKKWSAQMKSKSFWI